MTQQSQLQILFAYNWHTTRRLIDCAGKLSDDAYHANPGYGHGSIHDLLFHLLRANQSWRIAFETGRQQAGIKPDDYATLEATGLAQPDGVSEARLVGAVGYSKPSHGRRDDSRLRGWVGPTGATFGAAWDKGHFIAHSIGGAVDGLEANVFLQRRSVNRGAYREMERYCAANPGVLCFSRPLYSDLSALPTEVEFGVPVSYTHLTLPTSDLV